MITRALVDLSICVQVKPCRWVFPILCNVHTPPILEGKERPMEWEEAIEVGIEVDMEPRPVSWPQAQHGWGVSGFGVFVR